MTVGLLGVESSTPTEAIRVHAAPVKRSLGQHCEHGQRGRGDTRDRGRPWDVETLRLFVPSDTVTPQLLERHTLQGCE